VIPWLVSAVKLRASSLVERHTSSQFWLKLRITTQLV
jgi:hypothetical protein